jgi:hypothetical protein
LDKGFVKMRSFRYQIGVLTSLIMVAFSSEAGLTFTLIPPSSYNSRYYQNYEMRGVGKGYTQLLKERTAKKRDKDAFTQILQKRFPPIKSSNRRRKGYIFESVDTPLGGSFDFEQYFACVPYQICVLPYNVPSSNDFRVGGHARVSYHPEGNDPQTSNKSFWIQRVRSNHSLNPNRHGRNEDVVDQGMGSLLPYYSSTYNTFLDTSYREDATENHDWVAELYLAELQNPDPLFGRISAEPYKVKIFSGIQWGWKNRFIRDRNPLPVPIPRPIPLPIPEPLPVPVPHPIPVPPIVCNPSSGGGGCGRNFFNENSDQELLLFNSDAADDANISSNEVLEDEEWSYFDRDDTSWIGNEEVSFIGSDLPFWTEDEDLASFYNDGDSKSSTSVPESTSTLGLLALGAWGIVKALKIRKNK